jgi:transcription antitermination factor NusG
MQEILIAIGVLIIPVAMIWKLRKVRKRDYENLADDSPGADDIVIVEHRGIPVTMTQMEKLEYWDQMTSQEKKKHVHKIKTAIKKGEMVAVVWPFGEHAGRTVYVKRSVAKKKKLEEVRITKRYGAK